MMSVNFMKHPDVSKKHTIDSRNVLAALSYLWILFLIPLILKQDDEYVEFHAKQGLVLFICWLVGWLFFSLPLIGALLYLAIIIASALGVISALQGRYWELPLIGAYARKIKF